MKELLKKYSGAKYADIRDELAHAHLIVTLLALAAAGLLILGTNEAVTFDETLSAVGAGLLIVVGLTSLGISFILLRKKNK